MKYHKIDEKGDMESSKQIETRDKCDKCDKCKCAQLTTQLEERDQEIKRLYTDLALYKSSYVLLTTNIHSHYGGQSIENSLDAYVSDRGTYYEIQLAEREYIIEKLTHLLTLYDNDNPQTMVEAFPCILDEPDLFGELALNNLRATETLLSTLTNEQLKFLATCSIEHNKANSDHLDMFVTTVVPLGCQTSILEYTM